MKKLLLLLSAITLTLSSCLFKTSEIDNSLLPVKSGEKWGYVNKKGVFVINPQYETADLFINGIAQVTCSNGYIGYVNTKGSLVIPAKFSQGTRFYEGKAFVTKRGGRLECIDKKGNTLFVLKDVESVSPFSEGLAVIEVLNENEESRFGFVDEKGNIVINPQYEFASSFSEGLAPVCQNEKWGYIDKKGRMKIQPQFTNASFFQNGLACCSNGNGYGFIDNKGFYVIPPQLQYAYCFSEGLARFTVRKQGDYSGDKDGFINKKGKIIINPQYERANDFSNKKALIMDNNKYGYIDKTSNQIIPAQFDYATDFIGDVAFVRLGEKWGLIDKKGSYLINPQYEGVMDWGWDNNWPITTEYYDVSKQVEELLSQRHITTTSFDGFSANTTLQDIIDNPLWGDEAKCYGNGLNAEDSKNRVVSIYNEALVADMIKYWRKRKYENYPEYMPQKAVKNMIGEDMFIFPVSIIFQHPICRNDLVASKQYVLNEKISSILYLIVPLKYFYSDYKNNVDPVIEEIEKQLSAKLHLSFKTLIDKGPWRDYIDVAYSDKMNIALNRVENEKILMLVGFDTYSKNLIKKWGGNVDEFYEEYNLEDILDID